MQSSLFPVLKKWAADNGFQPGVIKYQKRVYSPPGSYSSLLSVFDELKKTVSQPKPGQGVERVGGEEVEVLRRMLEEVVGRVKGEVGYIETS